MVQRLYVNPKLIELVLDECSFCRRFYLYEKGIAYELECFLNTLLEKRDQKFIGGQIELLQRKIETLQFIKMMLEVCLRRGFKVLPNRWRSPLFARDWLGLKFWVWAPQSVFNFIQVRTNELDRLDKADSSTKKLPFEQVAQVGFARLLYGP